MDAPYEAEVIRNVINFLRSQLEIDARGEGCHCLVCGRKAKWKMENDCGQHPWLLATFFRTSVTKWKFYKQLHDAMIGAIG